jgi:ABC-type multidrug transport system permease subunit
MIEILIEAGRSALFSEVVVKALLAIVVVVASAAFGHHLVVFGLQRTLVVKREAASKWIGVFERAIITLLVLASSISTTVFVFAAKVAVMHFRVEKQPDPKGFTEYVLLGTLISYLVALLFGFAGRFLWRVLI